MILSLLALAQAGFVTGAAMTAWRRVRRQRRPGGLPRSGLPRVLVVRPVSGDDPWLARSLRSIGLARRSFEITVRVSVGEAEDPAVPIAEAVMSELRAAGIDAAVLIAPPLGPNRKASQIAAACEAEPHPITLCADGDIDLAGLDLDELVGPLVIDPHLGAVWAPPVEAGPARAWDAPGDAASAALLGGSLHAFPLLCGLDPEGLVGKLFCFKTESFSRLGGFRALVMHLGEDMELSARLRGAGLGVRPARIVAPSLARGRCLSAVVDRYSRWLQVIRGQRPRLLWSYPGMFFATPVALGLAVLGAGDAPWLALVAVTLALVGRGLTAVAARSLSGRSLGLGGVVVDMIFADLVLVVAFLRMLRSRRFSWRGQEMIMGADGRVVLG